MPKYDERHVVRIAPRSTAGPAPAAARRGS
jgi:hypothetical protein